MIIDVHTHLTDSRYADKRAVVKDFRDNNGLFMIDSAYDDVTSEKAKENAEKFNSVFAVVGIHPEKASLVNDEQLRKLAKLSDSEKVVAIGEIGLDYHYEGFDKAVQKEAFCRQVLLAYELGLPFVVHSRDASKDVYDCLKANKQYLTNGFLMHCYSESLEQAKNYLDLGAYFSFGGVITFKNAKKESIVKSIPLDRLLCETDAPYLTPTPHRGELNYPSYVRFVYEKMAEILSVEQSQLERIVLENAKRLFQKIKK